MAQWLRLCISTAGGLGWGSKILQAMKHGKKKREEGNVNATWNSKYFFFFNGFMAVGYQVGISNMFLSYINLKILGQTSYFITLRIIVFWCYFCFVAFFDESFLPMCSKNFYDEIICCLRFASKNYWGEGGIEIIAETRLPMSY